MTLAQWCSDEDFVKNGKWFGALELAANPDGTVPEFLLRPAIEDLNSDFKNACFTWRRKHSRAFRSSSSDAFEITQQMLQYGLKQACVKKWRNFQDDDHRLIEFTPENMNKYVGGLPLLSRQLLAWATEEKEYLVQEIEAVVGELSNTSSTP